MCAGPWAPRTFWVEKNVFGEFQGRKKRKNHDLLLCFMDFGWYRYPGTQRWMYAGTLWWMVHRMSVSQCGVNLRTPSSSCTPAVPLANQRYCITKAIAVLKSLMGSSSETFPCHCGIWIAPGSIYLFIYTYAHDYFYKAELCHCL